MDTMLSIRSKADIESPDTVASSVEPEPTLSATVTKSRIANIESIPKEQANIKDGTSSYLEQPISALSRVFGTPELLLMVMSEFSASDLLVNGLRVNKTWKEAIENDHKCQAKLCFRPIDPNDSRQSRDSFYWKLNPFLHLFSRDGEMKDIVDDQECYYDYGPTDSDTDSDPDDPTSLSGSSGYHDLKGESDGVDVYFEFDWSKIRSDRRFTRRSASWRKMLPINNPPLREFWYFHRPEPEPEVLEIRDEYFYSLNNFRRAIIELPPTGKSMGKIFDDVMSIDEEEMAVRTRTIIRGSSRYNVVVSVNVLLQELKMDPYDYGGLDSCLVDQVYGMDQRLKKRFGI